MATKKEVQAQIKATEAQVEAFALSLSRVFDRSLDVVLNKIRKGKIDDVVEVAATLADFEQELSRNGADKVLGRIREIYAEQLLAIRREFEDQGKSSAISSIDRPVIEQLITFDVNKIANKITPFIDDARSSIIRSVLLGEAPDEKILKDNLPDRLKSNIETEANTLTASFARAVTASKAKELGFELMIYLGPEDDITRDFCQELLDKDPPIYTIEEIEEMDNGQALPVLTSGGGYNCRHQWRPISLDKAQAQGYEAEGEEETKDDE